VQVGDGVQSAHARHLAGKKRIRAVMFRPSLNHRWPILGAHQPAKHRQMVRNCGGQPLLSASQFGMVQMSAVNVASMLGFLRIAGLALPPRMRVRSA